MNGELPRMGLRRLTLILRNTTVFGGILYPGTVLYVTAGDWRV